MKHVVMICAAMLVGAAAVVGQTSDPIGGTWTLNVSKSTFAPGPPAKSDTRTYEVTANGAKMISKGVAGDGTPISIETTYSYDGKDYPVKGNADYDTVMLKRVDAATVTGELKKAGKVVQTLRRTISKDGKILTLSLTGTNAKGQKVNDVLVYERR